jgi:hypothetical protein
MVMTLFDLLCVVKADLLQLGQRASGRSGLMWDDIRYSGLKLVQANYHQCTTGAGSACEPKLT